MSTITHLSSCIQVDAMPQRGHRGRHKVGSATHRARRRWHVAWRVCMRVRRMPTTAQLDKQADKRQVRVEEQITRADMIRTGDTTTTLVHGSKKEASTTKNPVRQCAQTRTATR